MNVQATQFDLAEVDLARSNLDILKELGSSLIEEFPDEYRPCRRRHALVAIGSTECTFPADRSRACHRIVCASIRRTSDQACLELAIGNEFNPAHEDSGQSGTGTYEKWRKSASNIPWREHVDLIRKVVIDLQEIGWFLPMAQFRPVSDQPFLLETGQRAISSFPSKLSNLASAPIRAVRAPEILVKGAWHEAPTSRIAGMLNDRARSPLFSGRPTFRPAGWREPCQASIVLVPQSGELDAGSAEVDRIAELETAGHAFSVCKPSSLSNRFPLGNVLFGLGMRLGAIPWTTRISHDSVITAMDAGHQPEKQKSRWVVAAYDTKNLQTKLHVRDGALEENLDDLFSDESVRSDAGRTELWRDGKLHARDRSLIASRFPSAPVVEIIKKPDTVLFRGSLDEPSPPRPGDAVVSPDGSVLVQNSLCERNGSYLRPVRARSSDIDPDSLCADLIALTARPTRSLFHVSSLPAPVYFADRASKLSLPGWLSAVGNGWRLPPIS